MSDSDSESDGGKAAQLQSIKQKKKRSFAELQAETFSQSAAKAEKTKKKRKRSKAAKKANEQSADPSNDPNGDEADDEETKGQVTTTAEVQPIAEPAAPVFFEDRQPEAENVTDPKAKETSQKGKGSRKGRQPKKRSKQKNIRKDTRPDHMKPQFRTVLPKPGQSDNQTSKQAKDKVVIASV